MRSFYIHSTPTYTLPTQYKTDKKKFLKISDDICISQSYPKFVKQRRQRWIIDISKILNHSTAKHQMLSNL